MAILLSPPSSSWGNIRVTVLLLFCISSALVVASTPVNAQSTECVNGKKLSDGTGCACDNCWSGETCNDYANSKPFFMNRLKEVDSFSYDPDVYTVEAVDEDERLTCKNDGPCPCAEVRYTIEAGNENNDFQIDTNTGKVTLNQASKDRHDLQIVAHNPGSDVKDTMVLRVRIQDSLLSGQVPSRYHDVETMGMHQPHHHIHKRAVTLPDNVTLTLTKTGENENVTEMRVGTKISFQLRIVFPAEPTDMLVELFAPDNDTIIMMLCNVVVQKKGINLTPSINPWNVVMDSQNSSNKYYDRAVIDFGSVTHTPTNMNDEDESAIIITWDAVMIHNDAVVADAVYWVSAGAEYNNETEVWVGQASFTAKTDVDATWTQPAPVFNLTGPSTLMVGQSAVFTLEMFITEPSTGLSIDAFAPLNSTHTNVMSVCGMKVVSAAENYECGFKHDEHVATLHADTNTRGNGRARLDLGTITNKGTRSASNPMENNRITVQFVVHVYPDTAVGLKPWVGAAVEIGTTQIWAGQIEVTVAALSAAAVTPTWNVTKEGSGKVSTVAPLQMTLDITIPPNTVGKYSFEVLAPFNDSEAVFQLCAIRIVSFGQNLLCTELEITPMYTSRGNPLYVDRGVADLGYISNVGDWGWSDVNATTPDDVLRIQFLMKATNHTLAAVGSSHAITLGLVMNDNRLMIGAYNAEVEAASAVPNITDETTPDWDLSWKSGAGEVAVGAAGQFLVNITSKRNTVYSPFDLEALMPNSTGATTQVSVCKVQVESIGKNLPCLLAAAVNSSVAYTSLLGDGKNDRAVLNLPSLCNFEVGNDTADDTLVLKVGFMLQPDAGLTHDQELWPSVGVMFSPYKMWVGQIKVVAKVTGVTAVAAGGYVAATLATTNVPTGYFAAYNVIIKPNAGINLVTTLNVTVATAGLSVCSVRIIQVGANMPCMPSAIEGVYEKDTDGALTKGSLDFGSIAHVGGDAPAQTNDVDDNTIVVEVLVGLTSDTTIIADASTHTPTIDVIMDGTTLSLTAPTPAFTAIHDQSSINMTATNVTKVEFVVAPVTETDNDTNVVPGQMKRFQLCVWTFPGTATKLSMKMMTPTDAVDVMEAAYIGVSGGGKNVPCAGTCKAGKVELTSRGAGSTVIDIASVDLGYMVNNNFDTVDVDANKVCVDGVFRVLKNPALVAGNTLLATAAVNVNDVEITVVQLPLTIVDNSSFVDTYRDNATLINGTLVSTNATVPDPLTMTPGDVTTFPMLMSVPPYVTSVVSMDIKLDVDGSACMTYRDIRLLGVGANLRSFGKDYDLMCTPASSNGTTQMDNVQCNFGIVTNPGMTHRCEDVKTEDDQMYLEVDVQMADCTMAVNEANITASFGFKVAGYIAILNYNVQVTRDGTEAPIYNITATANSTGATMYINYDVRLDNTSKAEVHDAQLYVMPPPYVTCDTLESYRGTNMAPPTVVNSATKMVIDLGSIYFTDELNLVVKCTANSIAVPNGISGAYTIVQHQVAGDVTPRAVSTLPSQTVWSDLDFVNFTATVVSEAGVSCTSATLDVEDAAKVFDCQISSSPASLAAATLGRKGLAGWQPYSHSSEQVAGARYFQVFFANKNYVDRVEVDQNAAGAKATEIKMAYSNDGKAFLDGATIALTGAAAQEVQVPSPQSAQVIRIYVTKQDVEGQLTLNFKLFGCETGTGGPVGQTAICAAAASAVPADISNALYFRRSFIEANSIVYVCDGVVKPKGVEQRCFTSPDGSVWQPLDSRVASLVGHDSETDRVFGYAHDGVTYMSSDDSGQTWASTHPDIVTASKAKGATFYTDAKAVKWEHFASGDPTTANTLGTWGANYVSLMKNAGSWAQKLKWNCC